MLNPQLIWSIDGIWWPPQTAMWVLAIFIHMAKEGSAQVCGGSMLLAPWMPWNDVG